MRLLDFFCRMDTGIIAILLYSLVGLFAYYLLPRKFRTAVLLTFNVLFYTLCEVRVVLPLLAGSILWTWWIAKKDFGRKRRMVLLGIVPVAALLFLLKYFTVLSERITAILNIDCHLTQLILPLGISYYIFKEISYVADVSEGRIQADKTLLSYAAYVSFFPEIVSGPISKYAAFKEALDRRDGLSKTTIENGFALILKGVFMKAVIANRLSEYVSNVFASPDAYPGLALWMAAFLYAVELYCDFGGYSYIVTGITRLFSLNCTENFRRPYLAYNIREFWKRWHISLTSWLREYVYFPLGGNRRGKLRSKINVLLVFLVSGMWHGTGVNFLIWGVYHGLLNIASPRKKPKTKLLEAGAVAVNFCLVTLGWIFFRSDTPKSAALMLKGMLTRLSLSVSAIESSILPFTGDDTCVAFFLIAVCFIIILFVREIFEERHEMTMDHIPSTAWQIFLLTAILLFGRFTASGFIYANF